MNSVVRGLGKVLRLVGISSPEDTGTKAEEAVRPPSWRDAREKPKEMPKRD